MRSTLVMKPSVKTYLFNSMKQKTFSLFSFDLPRYRIFSLVCFLTSITRILALCKVWLCYWKVLAVCSFGGVSIRRSRRTTPILVAPTALIDRIVLSATRWYAGDLVSVPRSIRIWLWSSRTRPPFMRRNLQL